MDKDLRILIPLVRAIARAMARRDHKREVEKLRNRGKSDDPQGKLPLGDD